jgi:hypothetical protein
VIKTRAGERLNVKGPDQPVVDDVAGHGREGRSEPAMASTEGEHEGGGTTIVTIFDKS